MLFSTIDERIINHTVLLCFNEPFFIKSDNSINTEGLVCSGRGRGATLKTELHSSLRECRLKVVKHPSAYQQPSNEHQATSSASTQSALSFISEREACLLMSALIYTAHLNTQTHTYTHLHVHKPKLTHVTTGRVNHGHTSHTPSSVEELVRMSRGNYLFIYERLRTSSDVSFADSNGTHILTGCGLIHG